MPLDEKMTMDEIMRRWPQTIRAVIRNGMLCVGCPIAPFHTAPEAAREHGLDWTLLRATGIGCRKHRFGGFEPCGSAICVAR